MSSYEKYLFKFLLILFSLILYALTQYNGKLPIELNGTQSIGLVVTGITTYVFSLFIINEIVEK